MESHEIFYDFVYFQSWSQIEAYVRGRDIMVKAFRAQNTPELSVSRPVDVQNIFCFDLTLNILRDQGSQKAVKILDFFYGY